MSTFPRLNIRLSLRPLSAALLFATPLTAAAVVLGEPVRTSAVGEPLRVEIAVFGGDLSRVAECLSVVPGTTEDGLPWIREAKIASLGRGPSARITVESAAPVFEPVLKLAIEDICDTRLRREYTLLLSFPDAPLASRPLAPPLPKVAPTTRAGRPPPSEARRHAATAGSREVPRKESARPAATRPPEAAQANRPPPPAAPGNDRLMLGAGAPPPGDRLRLSTELASFARIGSTSDAERDQLRREQNVLMAVDRTIVAQLELNERIRQLEDTQRRMLEHARAEAGATAEAVHATAAAPDSDEREGLYLAAILAALSLLLAVALLARRRRTYRTVEVDEPNGPGEVATPLSAVEPTEFREGPAAMTQSGREPSISDTTAEMRGAEGAAIVAPQPALPLPDEEAAEEHESAIELAEIMIGFGRVQGAAETLAEFIQSNPKKSVTPWLKLLEVYRAAGLRSEFDALARQLNKTFNVKSVTWETFDEARATSKSIEQMPHVAKTLTELWGTPACQAYLEKLLRDNRDGTREGFPLSAIDEILVLAAILEEELGALRASTPQSTGTDD